MAYVGKIYRPWPEAESLLIQVTLGCSVNTCTFCNMFRDKKFHRKSIEEIFADIVMARRLNPYVRSIFLIDGNVMILKTDFLLKVVNKITETFPEIQNIALYSGLADMRRKSLEELKALREAGVTMAYAGLESGDAMVLERIKKGMTQQHAIEGAALAKEAGIDVLQSFIFGLGGKERSQEHIEETVRLLNIMQPEQIAPMALTIQPGTELEQEVESGEFVQATPLQILQEEKYLLENLGDFETYYWGDHGNNIVPQKGWMPDDRKRFLKHINHAIATHPLIHEDVHQTFAW